MDNWCSPGSHASSQSSYQQECKEAAISICEGNIHHVADRWCPNEDMKTSDLRDLQKECDDQVNSMVSGDSDSNDRDGRGECGEEGVDDESPRPHHSQLGRFRFNLMESDAKCADMDNNLYEWGQFDKVKEFSECAEACVKDVRTSLLDSFRGYDWNCREETCHCLYDKGTLDSRNSDGFDRTNRNESGEGSVERTVRSYDDFCAKLSGAEVFGDKLLEIE